MGFWGSVLGAVKSACSWVAEKVGSIFSSGRETASAVGQTPAFNASSYDDDDDEEYSGRSSAEVAQELNQILATLKEKAREMAQEPKQALTNQCDGMFNFLVEEIYKMGRKRDLHSLLQNINKRRSSLSKDINGFHERLYTKISLDDPKCQEIFALSAGKEKEERMDKLIKQVLQDSLRGFQAEVREKLQGSIASVKERLEDELAKEDKFIHHSYTALKDIQEASDVAQKEQKQLDLAFEFFSAAYARQQLGR
ncbi:hypothetical protein [Helicobacter bizzozeronii]|uniref:hypothetical protein n=1 Tax=Helicobacter bizzozeronii TaxID=56877 RepID=UPI000CF159EC|nr:hypothetical protein [Helicobacter bizzozeronii]